MSTKSFPSNRRVVSMREMESNVRLASTKTPKKPWDPNALWRTLKTIGRVALAVGILGVGVFTAVEARKYVTTSPRFGLRDLRITYGGGPRHHTPDQIAQLAGVTLGENVVDIDLESTRQKLENDPWIERATITRRLPASVTIDVVEREASAIVSLPSGTYLSTAEGSLFKKLEEGDPSDLPVVTGLTPDDAGGDREATAQLVQRALELAKEIEHVGLFGGRVEELNVDRDGGVTAVIGKRAMRVAFGRGPYRPKVRLAAKIEGELSRRDAQATTIFLDDDSHPDRVVVRLVAALPPAEVVVDDDPVPPSKSMKSVKNVVANQKAKGGLQ